MGLDWVIFPQGMQYQPEQSLPPMRGTHKEGAGCSLTVPGKLFLRHLRRSLNSPLRMLARGGVASGELATKTAAPAARRPSSLRVRCSGSTRTALKLARMRSRAPRGESPKSSPGRQPRVSCEIPLQESGATLGLAGCKGR